LLLVLLWKSKIGISAGERLCQYVCEGYSRGFYSPACSLGYASEL
jgi:hypothetical protein